MMNNQPLEKIVARHLPVAPDSGPCPGDEELAALVDRRIGGGEREKLLTHLAGCADCYGLYVALLATVEDVRQQRRKRILTMVVPALLAASLALIFFRQAPDKGNPVMTQVAQTPTAPPPPVSVSPTAPALLADAKVKRPLPAAAPVLAAKETPAATDRRMVTAIRSNTPQTYGFSAEISLEQQGFRLGRQLADCEVALKAGEKELSLQLLQELAALLESAGEFAILRQQVEEKTSRLKRGEISELDAQEMVKSLPPSSAVLYSELGMWVEQSRLAARSGVPIPLTSEKSRKLQERLREAQAPAEVTDRLEKMTKLLAKPSQGRPPRELLREIEALQALF